MTTTLDDPPVAQPTAHRGHRVRFTGPLDGAMSQRRRGDVGLEGTVHGLMYSRGGREWVLDVRWDTGARWGVADTWVEVLPQAIGDRIATLRGRRSQEWLAHQVGVTRSLVSLWETGRRSVSLTHAAALARALECDAGWLAFGAPTTPPPAQVA